MRHSRTLTLLAFVGLLGACATRVPVVTTPEYPAFMFPTIPLEYARTSAAESHQEAWSFLQTGDLGGAEARYGVALTETPDFYPATTGLGWVSLARRDPQQAAGHFARAMTAAPTYVPALVGHADAMNALERPAAALESYEAALRVDPGLTLVAQRVEELRFTVVTDVLAGAREAADAGRYAEARAAYERVIETSPQSGFLRVELGRLEQRQGNLEAAVEHARRATELDADDPDAWLLRGELYEAADELPDALRAYEEADVLDPTQETAERIAGVQRLLDRVDIPVEVQRILSRLEVNRAELAALLGVRLSELLELGARAAVIVTDTRDHWASQWVQSVADAGVMNVDAAYRFSPTETLRRSDLAVVVAAVLDLIETETDSGAISQRPTESFTDMSPSHLSYAAATRAVAAGVLDRLASDSFQPSRVVTGAEAVRATDRLLELFHEFQ